MNLTNKHNLPQVFVDFEAKHVHSKGSADFSVTDLLGPPQIRHLEEKHDDELEEDIADGILRILGTAVHAVLEASAGSDDIKVEERLSATIEGYTISGGIDAMIRLEPTMPWVATPVEISDYKVTSATTLKMNPEGKAEWEQQVNIYGWLARKNGYQVKKLKIWVVVRDFRKSQAQYSKSYPQQAVVGIDIPMWTDEQCEEFIKGRLIEHTAADGVPPCSDEDRWLQPTKHAVFKYVAGGALGKRAYRVLDSRYDAEALMLEESLLGEIVERPGEAVRCKSWCSVARFCPQYQGEIDDV